MAFPQVREALWSGTGSNCRPSAFQALYRAQSGRHKDATSALLTRVDAAKRADWPILAAVPPCAGECRFVRVTSVLPSPRARTCVGFVLMRKPRLPGTCRVGGRTPRPGPTPAPAYPATAHHGNLPPTRMARQHPPDSLPDGRFKLPSGPAARLRTATPNVSPGTQRDADRVIHG